MVVKKYVPFWNGFITTIPFCNGGKSDRSFPLFLIFFQHVESRWFPLSTEISAKEKNPLIPLWKHHENHGQIIN
jgi:hypothetical protein